MSDRGFAIKIADSEEEIEIIAPKAPGSNNLTSDVDYTIRCQNLDLMGARKTLGWLNQAQG